VSMKRGGDTFYYITDRVGSVIALTSNASGQAVIVNQYWYSPWGEIVSQSERPNAQQPFRFAGAEYDAPLRLYKMGARYYNPAEGYFTQLDPLGGGYTYASNDPINVTDKTGLAGVETGGGIFGLYLTLWWLIEDPSAAEKAGEQICEFLGCAEPNGMACGPDCTGGTSGHTDTGAGGATGNDNGAGGAGGSGGAEGSSGHQ